MNKILIPLLLAVAVALSIASYITETSMKGALIGGDDISRKVMITALTDPDKLWWQFYPFGLLIGGIVGLIIFVTGYFIIKKVDKS